MDYETSENVNDKTPQANESHHLDSYLNLLDHAVTCQEACCSFPKCVSMKRIKIHVMACQKYKRVQCDFCSQFLALCVHHAKRCNKNDQCQVPFCYKLKVKLANLRDFKRNQQEQNGQLDSNQEGVSAQTFRQLNDNMEMACIERMLSSFVF